MLGKSPNQNQTNLFKPVLKQIINPRDPLVILSSEIDWVKLEKEFAPLYSNTGQPSCPIRLMAGLLILKQLFNKGDETVIDIWIQNPYYQYFCGEQFFQWEQPCDPSDLVHFRKRIGENGVDKIFAQSVNLHKDKLNQCNEVLIDTTVQEKNITFPTDVKLHRKIIEQCNGIAEKEGIELRQTYTRTIKEILVQNRFSHHPRRIKQARKAKKRLRTIAGRQFRDLERKLEIKGIKESYQDKLNVFERIIKQRKHDTNKIYSVHEPSVSCIAKGKAHKPYEFGTKTSFATLPKHNIVVGVACFNGNPHDSKTIEKTLEHIQKNFNKTFKEAIADRGYRGVKIVGETKVITPENGRYQNEYQRNKRRKQCRSRAAIEPIIGHMKSQYRLGRNYLKGMKGDIINALMAAASINFKSRLREIKEQMLLLLIILIYHKSEKVTS
jgi:transposase, IS5 family